MLSLEAFLHKQRTLLLLLVPVPQRYADASSQGGPPPLVLDHDEDRGVGRIGALVIPESESGTGHGRAGS